MQHASEMSPRHRQESVTWTMIDPEGLNNPCSALPPEMIVHKYLPSLLEQDTTCCFHIILAVAACTQREVCVFTSQL